jgi:hypothetical protein
VVKISKAQIADQRFIYYADEMLELLGSSFGARYYTHLGQLVEIPPIIAGTGGGEATYMISRGNDVAGVTPSLAEVQAAYGPTVLGFAIGDNVAVSLSSGSVEWWDVMPGGVMSLRLTTSGEKTTFGPTLPLSPAGGDQHVYTGGDLNGMIVERVGVSWVYSGQFREPILAAQVEVADAIHTAVVAALPVGGTYQYQVFRDLRYETDTIFKSGVILRNSIGAGGSGGTTSFVGLTDTPSSLAGTAGLFWRTNVSETALEAVAGGGGAYTHPNHTGDVTSLGDGATTIVNGAVTTVKIADDAVVFAKMQDIATQRVIGRNTAGAGDPEEVTASQVLSWISTTQGAVLYRNATDWVALPPGTAGQVLSTGGAGANPSWASVAAGGLTVTVSGGATILHDNAGVSPPIFSGVAGAGTLAPNGNLIVSIQFDAISSAGGNYVFTHNHRDPMVRAHTAGTGVGIFHNYTITDGVSINVTGLGISTNTGFKFCF